MMSYRASFEAPGPALDIPARLAYLPSFIIVLDLGTFIVGGIPMIRDELVGSVVLGAMAALISVLLMGSLAR